MAYESNSPRNSTNGGTRSTPMSRKAWIIPFGFLEEQGVHPQAASTPIRGSTGVPVSEYA